MKCTLDYDKILAYRLGELSGTGAEEVERHIASCPGCARELKAMDGILGGLAGLPRLEPDTARWVELRGAIEHKRRPGVVRLLSMLAHRLKRPAVAMVALLLVCAIGGYIFIRRESVPARRDIVVEEMGSTIAHTRPGDRGLGDVLDSYLNDSRALIAGALLCAAAADAGCWKELALKIAEKDMLYRGIWLRERLPRPSEGGRVESVKTRTLIGDSSKIFRAINEHSPERLTGMGSALGKEITRMDLLNRLTEGRVR